MKITAITRFKHADLLHAMRGLGWCQKELGRRTGMHQSTISSIINLKKRPSPTQCDALLAAS